MLTSIKYHPEVQVISLTGCVLVQRQDKPEVIPGKAAMMDDKHVCLKCRLHTVQLGNCYCLGWFSYSIQPSDGWCSACGMYWSFQNSLITWEFCMAISWLEPPLKICIEITLDPICKLDFWLSAILCIKYQYRTSIISSICDICHSEWQKSRESAKVWNTVKGLGLKANCCSNDLIYGTCSEK